MREIAQWRPLTLLIPLGLLALAACSATRLAYDNADFFLLRWVDRYIELTDAQEKILEAGLARSLEQHRAELLPDYVLYLRGAAVVFSDGLNRSDAECLVTSFEELYRRTVELVIPLAATILADLNDRQIAQLTRRLEKDDARFVREWLQQEREQRLQKRAQRFVEKIEDWTGELYARQTELVTRSTLEFPDTAPGWYAYRLGQQKELLARVSAGDSAESIDAFLRAWWITQSGLDSVLVEQIEEGIERFVDMMVELDGVLTAEQRERVVSRLHFFADALEPALSPTDQTVIAALSAPSICSVSSPPAG